MRLRITILCHLVALATIAWADSVRALEFHMSTGEVKSVAVSRIDSIAFDTHTDMLKVAFTDGSTTPLPMTGIDSMCYATLPDGVYVNYEDGKAKVENPYAFDGIEIYITGAKVTVKSAISEEVAYHLAGQSTRGAFKLYGQKKYELHLDGLRLTNDDGAAINIQCKKRGQIYLTEGTDNYLADGDEYTPTEGEDQKGTLFSEGQLVVMGSGALTVDGHYKHALCSDDYIAMNDGVLTIASATADGMHANDSVIIRGGLVQICANDDAIDCEGLLCIRDGEVTITSDTEGAKGLKSDTNICIAGGTTSIAMQGNRAEGIKADDTVWLTGGSVNITTTGAAAYDEENDISYATAIKSDGDYLQEGGTLVITTSGMGGQGISVDGTLTILGGTQEITIAGTGSSYTTTSGTTDYYSVKALKSDGAMNLLGGTIICKATGNGGKCIVSDGLLTIGDEEGAHDLSIRATTSGSALSSGSSTNQGGGGWPGGGWPGGGRPGGGGPGGMGGGGFNAAPKAIKGAADVIINNGTIYVETKADGGEGIESKATMTINGGIIECSTYDDGINAATNITINGGHIYCHATNNDGIDSNGTIRINGGVAVSSGTSAPEEGFDCDSNSFIISGGILLGTGGATSSPTSASQCYAQISSVTLTKGKYLSVKDSSGAVLFSYLLPNSINNGTVLVSAPQFTNTSHTLMYGVTSVSEATETYFDGVFIMGGQLSGGSSKTFTPKTK